MPSTLPKLVDLLPPLDGRPFDRREWNELRAVRLALVMVTTVLHQSDLFLFHNRPITGGHTADQRWLHQHLEPLARHSPTVKKIRTLFDLSRYGVEWYNPVRVRRNLKLLAEHATHLGNRMGGAAPSPPRRQSRGR